VKSRLTIATFKSFVAMAMVVAFSLSGGPAAAQDCGTAVAATKAEWQSLAQGNHRIPPGMIITTSDGRRLSGSQLNYAWALIERADFTCIDPEPAKAMAYLSKVHALLHPAVSSR
jgi:hypothetical protein